MIDKVLTSIFGSKHERDVKQMLPDRRADQRARARDQRAHRRRAAREDRTSSASAFAPPSKRSTRRRKKSRATKSSSARRKEDLQAALDDILPEAFAVAREGGKRVLNMRHFDVQLMGGIVLHRGKIAEMKTGEGKTLVATLPVYLNALTGRGVHVVTVNDYLARRDSEWMGRLYKFLGLTVGVIQNQHGDRERQEAYGCDVTYGTNNEFGFDYLRDNMKFDLEAMVQRDHVYAIVDEVDSILIDEARTPLIISGPSEESVDKYYSVDRIIPRLDQGEGLPGRREAAHRRADRGGRRCTPRSSSASTISTTRTTWTRCTRVQQALRAHTLYKLDVEYVVKDGEVIIVDEFTGRLMPGRRWSDGLHQAVEAKEGVKIEAENQTLATITFQNLFRMYEKLAGMTGTADTEAAEFDKIYKLEVVVIPPNRPMVRKDQAGPRLPHRAREVRRHRRGDQGAATRRDSRRWSARSRSKSRRRCRRR